MNRHLFSARRALFVLPLGMTAGLLGRRLAPGRRKAAPVDTHEIARHPIDEAYGIDTGGLIKASQLRTHTKADLYNFGYAGSQPSIVRKAIEALPSVEGLAFVDLGCGKGRALAVASEYPFREVVGIELAPDLCRIAEANAKTIRARYPQRPPIEVVQGNVLETAWPEGDLAIFIYHAFYRGLMRKVVERLARRARERPQDRLFVIYYNPVYARLFDRTPELYRFYAGRHAFADAEARASEFGNQDNSVVVWQGRSTASAPAWPGAEARVRVTAGGASGDVQGAGR
ncbi:MAG: methyltransferase domain-containing protein [Caulobacteraceae bacterium]|nr:methyltransferase domain-containing protein [Caulobacteraceae bacterium]